MLAFVRTMLCFFSTVYFHKFPFAPTITLGDKGVGITEKYLNFQMHFHIVNFKNVQTKFVAKLENLLHHKNTNFPLLKPIISISFPKTYLRQIGVQKIYLTT